MTDFFTSDTHFNHEKIIEYCARPFTNAEEMNECLIDNWNKKVPRGADVWHTGDVIFAGAKDIEKILPRLHGKKHLILGNHDKPHVLAPYFESVQYYKEIKVSRKNVILMHYPIASWNKESYGAYHFHGHLHGQTHHYEGPPRKGRVDVGCDCWGYAPVSFEELHEHLKERDNDL